MNQTKEEFVVPKVTQTAWFELEDELLGESDLPQEFENLIQSTGHERVVVTGVDTYWEE